MRQITLRVSDESLAFVRRTSRQNKTAEAFIWRQLIETGIHRSDEVIVHLEMIAKLVVQALCMSQRMADHIDEDLVEKAREDALILINRMESVHRSRLED